MGVWRGVTKKCVEMLCLSQGCTAVWGCELNCVVCLCVCV